MEFLKLLPPLPTGEVESLMPPWVPGEKSLTVPLLWVNFHILEDSAHLWDCRVASVTVWAADWIQGALLERMQDTRAGS